MKKIIFLFLLISSFSFSNSIFDTLSKDTWHCSNLSNSLPGLIYVKFLTHENNNPYILITRMDVRNTTKTGKMDVIISKLDFEIKENENSIYFTNLNSKTEDFSDFKLGYSFDKKNRAKLNLYRISDNKKVCSFSAN